MLLLEQALPRFATHVPMLFELYDGIVSWYEEVDESNESTDSQQEISEN